MFSLFFELMFAMVVAMSTGEAGDQLQELREAIEGLDLPVHGTVLAEARALLDRFTAALAVAESDYCATARWQIDGFGSMAAFARHRYKVSDAEGRRIAMRAERMAAWPELLQAWLTGTLTGAQVDATIGLVPERHVERFATTAAENVAIVTPLNLSDTREGPRAAGNVQGNYSTWPADLPGSYNGISIWKPIAHQV